MRIRTRWVSTLIMLLIGTLVANCQEDTTLLTFDNALQIMKSQNPELLRAREYIKQKEYEKSMKKGLYMPHISVGAKAVSMSDPIHLDLTDVRDAITPLYDALGNYGMFSGVANPDPTTNTSFPVLPDDVSTQAVRQSLLDGKDVVVDGEWDQVIQDKTFATVTADLVWPIFTGGKIKAANKAAGVEIEIGHEDLRKIEGGKLNELVSRYYGLVLAYQAVEVRQQMFEAMNKHYSDAQKLFDHGMIAKVELLSSSVARNEAERELKQSKRTIKIIQSGLMATLSVDSVMEFLPTNHLFIAKEIPSLEQWILTSYDANPQLKQIEGKGELVDIKTAVDKGNYLPTVAMLGTYNIAEKNLSPYTPDWLVGVAVKWNVFEGLSRNNQLKVSRSMQEQVDHVNSQAHESLKAYITKLYNELNMQLEQIDELESTLELAQEYCESTEKAFNEGFATSSLVVDANTKVAQVKVMRLKVFYDYDLTLSTLMQTAGVPELFANYSSGNNTIVESLKN